MSGYIWPDTAYGLPVFVFLSLLGSIAALAAGRAMALVWTPLWRIIPASALLAAAVRFLHMALFQEKLLSLHYYLVTFAVLLAVAWTGYTLKRASQMATQYPWAFRKFAGSWRDK